MQREEKREKKLVRLGGDCFLDTAGYWNSLLSRLLEIALFAGVRFSHIC